MTQPITEHVVRTARHTSFYLACGPEAGPLLIFVQLEQYNYAGAAAIATVMLMASFVLLLIINILQRWSARRHGD